ncbi:WD40/YVTN/BNR-like repeat-containing protein [Pseudorhodobacter ferrugineus]|uniref:WD40/YVTN/BNR-like repeat-containing protein n=1 Tax=Pseudorhodobacter ferrugineus TaxID=77008 RepID=UPI000ABF625B|nr:hypothetical protein [Pseudorhodobacter ferrugineus]
MTVGRLIIVLAIRRRARFGPLVVAIFRGAGVWRSDDNGENWALALLANGKFDEMLANDPEMAAYVGDGPVPDAPFKGQIDALWSLCLVGGTLFAGAKPAALFARHDRGDTWARVQGLSDHPSGDSWQPGGAGLTLHPIVADRADPAKMWVGISAAGVFATEDAGKTWDEIAWHLPTVLCVEVMD